MHADKRGDILNHEFWPLVHLEGGMTYNKGHKLESNRQPHVLSPRTLNTRHYLTLLKEREVFKGYGRATAEAIKINHVCRG